MTAGRVAEVAQRLVGTNDVTALATWLMVSRLRIDSPLLTGVEFKFRIVVFSLVAKLATDLAAAPIWLGQLTDTLTTGLVITDPEACCSLLPNR